MEPSVTPASTHARLGHGSAVNLLSHEHPLCGTVNTHVWANLRRKLTAEPVTCKKCLKIQHGLDLRRDTDT